MEADKARNSRSFGFAKMKIFLGLLIFLGAIQGHAQSVVKSAKTEKSDLQFYLLNYEMRFERGNSQELENKNPQNFAIAYRFEKISVLLEYSQFAENSGNSTASIERKHQDMTTWFRHHFFYSSYRRVAFSLFGGVGAGAFREEVKTSLLGSSRTDQADAKFMSGLAVGGDLAARLSPQVTLLLGVEGRALLAAEFEPNPLWSMVVRSGIGIQF